MASLVPQSFIPLLLLKLSYKYLKYIDWKLGEVDAKGCASLSGLPDVLLVALESRLRNTRVNRQLASRIC